MSAQLLDGKVLAGRIKDALRQEIDTLNKKAKTVLTLKTILIGEDPAALAYANSQKKAAQDMGIQYELVSVPSKISQAELTGHIEKINKDSSVHGAMVLKPLPISLNYEEVINALDSAKDIEGLGRANMGKILLGQAKIIPATAASCMEHIRSTGVPLRGKEAVIIGRSEIVGKPVSLLLLGESATVTMCHTGTKDAGTLTEHVKRADILVVAVGKPGFVKGEWVKKGSIVVDVGINKVGDKITGDVEFEEAKNKAAFITPVPGGVGPLTTVMLMKNACEAFKLQVGR